MPPCYSRPLPLPYGYWVPGADMLAGEYPGAPAGDRSWEVKLRRLHAAGVTCFYDLTEPGELEPYADKLAAIWGEDGCAYRRFPIRDASVPQHPQLMRDILDRLDADLSMGHRVYLHCWGGVGRTGMTVACFLMQRGLEKEEALEEVRQLFALTTKAPGRRAPETEEQGQFVLEWGMRDPAPWVPPAERALPLPCPPGLVRGALLGLAVGDALGTTLEFKLPGTFQPITDMVGGGAFGLEAGQWTDDTSMALCLAESLVETGRFDAADQMRRYVRWWREGHLSSTGRCFDIGGTTSEALLRFKETGDPFSGPTDPHRAGNGSLMRLAPVVMFFRDDPAEAVSLAGESSRTTHATKAAVDACRYFAALLLGALRGVPKDELLSWGWVAPLPFWRDEPLHPEVVEVAKGSWRGKEAREINASGHVIRTLEAALWAFQCTEDFRSGALAAVNLGRDADTTGAVYGQIAGAWYGEEGIPEEWRAKLALRERMEELAEGLVAARPKPGPSTHGITRERADELLAFLPVFEAGGERVRARWNMGGDAPEGVVYAPYPDYPEVVEEFYRLAYQWWWRDYEYEPDTVSDLVYDDRRIERASLAEVMSMLTYCVRGERFCTGHWGGMIREGRVQAVLRRLSELREEMEA